MDYTQLIGRLRLGASISRERKLNQGYEAVADEAAAAIEAMQTKVVELDHDTADLAMLADQYKAERDSALEKLAALEKQGPVAMGFAPHGVVTDALAITRVDDPEYNVPLYLAAGAQPDTAREYMTGYSDGKQWAEGQMVPLTDAQVINAMHEDGCERIENFYVVGPVQKAAVFSFARAVEKAHGIGGSVC